MRDLRKGVKALMVTSKHDVIFKLRHRVTLFCVIDSQTHKTLIDELFRNIIIGIGGHLHSSKSALQCVHNFFKVFYKELMIVFTLIYLLKSKVLNRVLKCDVIKMKFLKLWDLSGYSERTMSKRPTCQKWAFRGKLSLRS